ncbi:DegT/DnrJ/EryC1/StrS family aminotransferase [Rhodothermus marinus]|uniref:DegT/DnrJ/EryC1/StrS aminotransferase n=1 Tax=Rhodothermus marinus (strain ATCC 43812 / DSM 4252 / R-10) TaxID=518766 RepID=D0MG66_RHOM4|nr:DegT/DnrJ/EryC1/StrS family aminotransferase [Rhodothermus marinus]ACY47622.1 DegT/DnrJ/EryC1/StrS aminotransferase [Rhodothermus marinus DSM 4252]
MAEAPPALQMVDLVGQYRAIRGEVLAAIEEVLESGQFIRGPIVARFEEELAAYLGCRFALGVGNGTDALQLAYMALDLKPGDEVIVPAFTFVATAEAAALLGIRPVFADIDPRTFNLDPASVEARISPRTRAIVPVHLFGQAADLTPLLELAERHRLFVIEDNAQAIGATYRDRKTGTFGHIGCLSFFPSKNLGAYGDGGAVLTNDPALHERLSMLANHGARRKYYHELIGVNSRLDALQAAILRVKLRHLDAYTRARQEAAARYDTLLADCPGLTLPYRAPERTHVFHQYTIRVHPDVPGGRDGLRRYLEQRDIPTAVYYPVPLHRLPAFADYGPFDTLPEAEKATREVLSLPMHTELTPAQQTYIAEAIRTYVETALRTGRPPEA